MKEKQVRHCGVEKLTEEEMKERDKQIHFEVEWEEDKKSDKKKKD